MGSLPLPIQRRLKSDAQHIGPKANRLHQTVKSVLQKEERYGDHRQRDEPADDQQPWVASEAHEGGTFGQSRGGLH